MPAQEGEDDCTRGNIESKNFSGSPNTAQLVHTAGSLYALSEDDTRLDASYSVESLRKQLQSLQDVCTLKDEEISSLKRELASARLELESLKSPKEIINPLASPSEQQERLANSLFSPTKKEFNLASGSWEIPQRSERRSVITPHSHNVSISSITSSHYSLKSPERQLAPPDIIIETPIQNSSGSRSISLEEADEDEDEDDEAVRPITNNSSNDNKNETRNREDQPDMTLDLSNTSNLDFATLGSSPRKSTPVRYKFTEEELNSSIIESVIEEHNSTLSHDDHTATTTTSATNDNSSTNHTVNEDPHMELLNDNIATPTINGDENFNFNKFLITPNVSEPVYKKLSHQQNEENLKSPITQRMLMSRTSSGKIETISSPLRSPTADKNDNIELSNNKQLGATKDLTLTPLTPPRLEIKGTQAATAIPAEQEFNGNLLAQQSLQTPKDDQKSTLDNDSQKFLLNSLQRSVIKVETIVDPVAIVDPKTNDYWIIFMVYSDENPNKLTPMYRVKKRYNDFLILDKQLRPYMPFLEQLPELESMRRYNYRLWEQNKLLVNSYVVSALIYLKRDMPNMELPKRAFATYFEFAFPPNHDLNEENGFNLLNLRAHLNYLLYAKQKFPNKTYDVVQLIFNEESDCLILKSFTSKSEQIYRDDTIVQFKGQEIVLKKKKKFSTNKVWVLYAESQQDGENIGNRLKQWLNDDTENEVYSSDEHVDSASQFSFPSANNSQNNLSAPGVSPSLGWSLFSKRASKLPPASTAPSPSLSSSSPHKLDDVLTFKSQPYEGVMTTSASSIRSSNTNSPNKLKQGVAVFEPIDSSPKYFGNTLQGAFDLCPKYQLGGHNVPSVIFRCLNYLHSHSAEGFEGIFRLNGMMSEVNLIEREFNSNNDCAFEDLNPPPDVYSVATLMKRYLRKVEGGIIIDDTAEKIYQIIKNGSELNADEVQQIKILINELPVMNRDVLFVVFKYIQDVLKQGAHNKMGVNAMSVLIGPNITETRGMPISITLMSHFNKVFARD